MNTKFIKNNSDELIIFFTGWGCDDIQFLNIKTSKNLLLIWDYTELNDFNHDFSKYKKNYLITYSAGVFASNLFKNKLPKLDKKIAISGNPLIFDEYFGISKETLRVMKSLNLDNYMDFRRKYLVYDDEQLEIFNQNASQRTFESCDNELSKLEEYYKTNFEKIEFDKAIIGEFDKIFNPEHQKEYYKDKIRFVKNSGHNVFYYFTNLDDILAY